MAKKTSIEISTISLFPEFVQGYTQFGIIARAIEKKILKWQTVNLRDFGFDARKTVDDRPYGGGVGMVLRPDVLHAAVTAAKSTKSQKTSTKQIPNSKSKGFKQRVVLLTPAGKRFTQKDAARLAKYDKLVFVSARYEGYDERITKFVDEELSIGDYVLMGGELPALVISEAVLRLLPGVLGKDESSAHESFSEQLLEHPQYTKPETWVVKSKTKDKGFRVRKLRVPKVLLTGHHQQIAEWRATAALKKTQKIRPDLL
jgi:tRNA (guanine37-N1)-methyltransferase